MDSKLSNFIAELECSDLYRQAFALYHNTQRAHAKKASLCSVEVAYLEFGSDNQVPLIWAHGSCLTSFEVLNIQHGLVKAGYRVIAIDYRGHGETQGAFTDKNTSLYHIADDIAQLMQYLGLEKAIVGGFSKGGWVATAFYDAYPDRVMGLLLEDGGSFSHLRLKEEFALGIVSAELTGFPIEAEQKLYHPSTRYSQQVDGVKAALALFAPLLRAYQSPEFIALLISLFHQEEDGCWRFHCENNRLMGEINRADNAAVYYSLLPVMQQSQELMLPKVIYRNLHVPLHIIDPVSPSTELPVEQQNQELADLHPQLITHERYIYDYSPHGAHLQRPDRFVASATQLFNKVMDDQHD